MKINSKGFTEVSILVSVIIGLMAFFVPNPISQTIGIGNKQNKIVQKQTSRERIELLKDDKGNVIATKTYTDDAILDADEQQRLTLWEQLWSLPSTLFLLVILGAFFPPLGALLGLLWRRAKKAYQSLHGDTKRVVTGLDKAFSTVAMTLAGEALPGEVDRAALAKRIVDKMKDELGYNYNDSTKTLVRSMR